METIQDFDRAYEILDKELDSMSGKEFFNMFGIDIDTLPEDEILGG